MLLVAADAAINDAAQDSPQLGIEVEAVEANLATLEGVGLRCENYFQARKLFECVSLCRYFEQRSDKLRLPLRITSC